MDDRSSNLVLDTETTVTKTKHKKSRMLIIFHKLTSRYRHQFYFKYQMMLVLNLLFVITAFLHATPKEIIRGLVAISLSRGVLVTDYVAVGGLSAALINSALVGTFSILMLMHNKVKPNGSIVMALWLSAGFAMFGKNLINMLPLTFGVWLYAKFQKEPFINYALVALLSATLSPVVSGIAFHPEFSQPFGLCLGVGLGILTGFIFPSVSAFTVRVHGGFNLYNLGFSGGLISTFLVAGFESLNISMGREMIWAHGNSLVLSVMLYVISALLIVSGLRDEHGVWIAYRELLNETGQSGSDFLTAHGNVTYFNMGLLGILATTLMIAFGADINGPVLSGIFTIIGFGAMGKHIRNVAPILIGAIISTYVNVWDPREPANTLAILFSTGLAPIAGRYGYKWGIAAGFIHVMLVNHIGFLNNGFNLYNNGYAAGFVVLLLVPIINALSKDTQKI